MNRKITAIAIFTAAFAIPATASAEQGNPTGNITASVDCTSFTVDVTDLQATTAVFATVGAEPPYELAVTDGHAASTFAVGAAEQGTEFFAAVALRNLINGNVTWPFQQWVDCTQTVKVALPLTVVEPVVMVGLPLVVETVYGNYQLAPPEG